MDPGYILIVAILILGGSLATVGDRIGTRVGKARLSLFKLRPKNTAVLVTIVTGTLISASTLAILFAADDGLRKGVFELDEIQKDLTQKREEVQRTTAELDTTKKEKTEVQAELNQARVQETQAQKNLQATNQSLQKAIVAQQSTQTQLNRTIGQQKQTQNQLQRTQSQLGEVVAQYKQAIGQLTSVYDERKQLQAEIETRKVERQRLLNEAKQALGERDRELEKRQQSIGQRDRKISQLDGLIQKRNLEVTAKEQVIAQRETRLKELETQQDSLEQEVARLEKYSQLYRDLYRDLRLGKLALVRGQILVTGVVRVEKTSSPRQLVIELLQEANRNAGIELAEPGTQNPGNLQILQITQQQVEQLAKQINDGREYVVRVFSAGNYVRGEKRIEFFADAARNQVVFSKGEVLAAIPADPKTMTSYQLRQRIESLVSASQFRARNAGILENIQVDGTFLRFLAQLRQYDQPVDIKAIAVEDTYTAGPLKVKLVAIQNGQVIFST